MIARAIRHRDTDDRVGSPNLASRSHGPKRATIVRLATGEHRRILIVGFSMTLLLHDLPPIHWALAGGAIAAITLLLLFVANRRLGLSTGFEDLCSFALPYPAFRRNASGRIWRAPFLVGLLLGGFLSAWLAGGWTPIWSLGAVETLGLGRAGTLVWMFAGGLCIGFGTRLAGGCTSGHGIFGLSNFEWPSLLATLSFMTSGVVTTHLVYRILF